MEMILIALVIGFAGGALGALVAIDAKTADITTTLKTLYKLQTDIESRLEKNEERTGLIDDAVRIVATEQVNDRAKLWGSINTIWHTIDNLKASKEPAQEPKQEEQGNTHPEPEQPAEQPETKPKQAKTKAKKKAEGESNE